jgi:thioredoxin-dependent peroxiredoxin
MAILQASHNTILKGSMMAITTSIVAISALFITISAVLFMGPFNATCKAAAVLQVGSQAPVFKLSDEQGKERTLEEFKNQYVVLYFYPKDETPGCTKQACSLRDNFDAFSQKNIVVLGISYDKPAAHKSFKEKHKLPFILLSDSDKSVAKAYGAAQYFLGFTLPIPQRKTFVIAPGGTIIDIMPNVDVSMHTKNVLERIEAHKQA